jgi:hypothetical protein
MVSAEEHARVERLWRDEKAKNARLRSKMRRIDSEGLWATFKRLLICDIF